MGLVLNNQQTNDAKILYLTDESTWDDGDLPVYTAITDAYLDIYYRTPDGISEIYNINVTNIFTGAASVDDLIFPITSIDVGLGGDVVLPDGIWTVAYTVTDGTGTGGDPWSFDSDLELLLDAIIKVEVYRQVSTIVTKYYCSNNYYTKPIDDILLIKGLYDSMLASAYVAKQDEIINILEVLQRQTA